MVTVIKSGGSCAPCAMSSLPRPMNEPQVPFYRAGDAIPKSGIYRVFHVNHRVSHEVTLLRGEVFPRCEQCGDATHFELVRAASSLDSSNGFGVRLYVVPHPESKKEA